MRVWVCKRFPAAALAALLLIAALCAPVLADDGVEVVLRAIVALTGESVPEERVTVLLEPQGSAPAPEDTSGLSVAVSAEKPEAEASCTLRFTSPGDYRYILREQAGSTEHMTYDLSAHVAVVRVTYVEGALTAVWWVEGSEGAKLDSVRFANSYAAPAPEPTPGPVPTEIPLIQLHGVKVWVDEDDAHHTRPSSIEVVLYADGVPLEHTPRWSNKDSDVWTYSFSRLPQTDETGRTIQYTVRETPVPYYTSAVDGMTITNTLVPREPEAFTSVSGRKTWDDNENERGLRPDSVTVHLLQDGALYDERVISAETEWRYTFEDLPADDGYGNAYTYAIREGSVNGYYAWVDGYDLSNRLLPDEVPEEPRKPVPFRKYTEEELEGLIEIFDYDTPLWGMLLGTGEELPIYPFVFAGVGCVAVALLVLLGRRRRNKEEP